MDDFQDAELCPLTIKLFPLDVVCVVTTIYGDLWYTKMPISRCIIRIIPFYSTNIGQKMVMEFPLYGYGCYGVGTEFNAHILYHKSEILQLR